MFRQANSRGRNARIRKDAVLVGVSISIRRLSSRNVSFSYHMHGYPRAKDKIHTSVPYQTTSRIVALLACWPCLPGGVSCQPMQAVTLRDVARTSVRLTFATPVKLPGPHVQCKAFIYGQGGFFRLVSQLAVRAEAALLFPLIGHRLGDRAPILHHAEGSALVLGAPLLPNSAGGSGPTPMSAQCLHNVCAMSAQRFPVFPHNCGIEDRWYWRNGLRSDVSAICHKPDAEAQALIRNGIVFNIDTIAASPSSSPSLAVPVP